MSSIMAGIERKHDPRVVDGGVDAFGGEDRAAFSAAGSIWPKPSSATRPSPARILRADSPEPTSPCSAWAAAPRPADRNRAGRDVHGVLEHLLEFLVARRGEHRHARDLREQHEIEHTVMTRTVGAGDTGAVETEDHREAVQADIEVDLVDRPGEEGRVDGDQRSQATHRHAGGGGDGVLLRDTDVDAPIREPLAEGQEAGRVGHGGGDGDQLGVLIAQLHKRLGERCGVGPFVRPADRQTGLGVVHRLDLVLLGGSESLALLGEHMDDAGPSNSAAFSKASSIEAMS